MRKINSIQKWIPIEKILEKGIIKLKKNKYIKILKVNPINFNLKTQMEKESILNSYKIFLKTCNFDIQILIQSKKEDLTNHIEKIKINSQNENNKFINNYLNEYINYIKEKNNLNKSASKNFYLIIKNKTENNEENSINDIQNNDENIGGAIEDIDLQIGETSEIEEIQKQNSEELNENIEKENNEVIELSQMEQDANFVKENISIIKPINGTISSRYGLRNPTTVTVPKNHTGIDLAETTGTKIVSATDGTVILNSSKGDYGNHLKIQNGDATFIYAHCSKLYVNEGDIIQQGQEIAEVGATGNATGPHLHFEIRYQNRLIDPELILEF